MPIIHKWRRRETKHFGDTWVPFAHIELETHAKQFQGLALQLDSGAVVSLLRRSVADLLGIPLESGKKIELSNVGGGRTTAFVHDIRTRFDPLIVLSVPYAIATTETVPNLLGRRGVFDTLHIDFDATFNETRIELPWLGPGQRCIWEFVAETEQYILDRRAGWPFEPNVKDVIRRLLIRSQQLLVSLLELLKSSATHASPVIIRAMFELSLQFDYLMADPVPRARDYEDYAHITRRRQSKAIAENPVGPMSKCIADSPDRPNGEKRNEEAYQRVRPRFLVPRGKKQEVARAWYRMSIAKLANTLARDAEYRLWYSTTSAWAHGDPFSTVDVQSGWITQPRNVLLSGLRYHARMLLTLADAAKLILPDERHADLKKLASEVV